MFAARMQANAARAVALGLGAMGAGEPPALYSFDADIGRLTITTPRYSTAVLPVNQRPFPTAAWSFAASTTATSAWCRTSAAGRGPASACWCATGGKEIATSQRPALVAPPIPPLTLLSSPHGRVAAAQPYPTRPYAGPFESLIAQGRTESREVVVDTTHKFTPGHVETRWAVARRIRGALHGRRAVSLVGQDRARGGGDARRPPRDARRGRREAAQGLAARRRVLLPRRARRRATWWCRPASARAPRHTS